MREIKFRGWQPELKKWIYGSLVTMPQGGAWILDYQNGFEDRIRINANTVGQCTGLTDKNGKEIYEGDILDSSEKVQMIFEVYFQDGGFRYGTKDRSVDISFSGHNWLESILSRFHIISNIHENPELIKP